MSSRTDLVLLIGISPSHVGRRLPGACYRNNADTPTTPASHRHPDLRHHRDKANRSIRDTPRCPKTRTRPCHRHITTAYEQAYQLEVIGRTIRPSASGNRNVYHLCPYRLTGSPTGDVTSSWLRLLSSRSASSQSTPS